MATAEATLSLRLERLRPALGPSFGIGSLALLAVAVAAGHPAESPLSPDHPGGDRGWSWVYLGALAGSFLLYLGGIAATRHRTARLAPVLAVAVVIQVTPLAGPVLLSTDAYTYWAYGRLAAIHGENPYDVTPSRFPDDPAYPVMGADWQETTSVYGPGFTLLSEGHAALVGESPSTAAWAYRAIATICMLALVALAARLGERRAFAAAFVGWNPLLAVHFAGGGHNDALMMTLVLAALALAASRRPTLTGISWAASIAIKWVPLIFLALRAIEARATGRPVRHLGFAIVAGVIVALALWRYGLGWIGAVIPLARNFEKQAVYSIPHRFSDLTGVSEGAAAALFAATFALALLWLAREAWRGRARLGLAAGLMLVCTPWLVPWYAVWAVPLAAIDEDRTARVLALGMSAYLLRDAVPL
jgi:alpha-1,6-mannosyltransferase